MVLGFRNSLNPCYLQLLRKAQVGRPAGVCLIGPAEGRFCGQADSSIPTNRIGMGRAIWGVVCWAQLCLERAENQASFGSWGVWCEVVGQCGNLDEVINALEVGELKVVSPKHLGD